MNNSLPIARRAPGVLALLGALALGTPQARAQEPEETDPADAEPGVAVPVQVDPDAAPPWRTRIGGRLVAGAPDGVGLSVLIHPRPWLRAHAGAARNGLGFGVRAGVDLIPLSLTVAPSLTLEYAHGFRADYDRLLDRLHGQDVSPATTIREVAYDQLGASVCLEYSPSRYVTLFGGVGISYWFIGVSDVRTFVGDAVDDPALTSSPLLLGLSSPVARVGLILSFD